MSEKELISVIIPCYKVEKYVETCLLSVINQTYKNFEIIAVDDGSPDNTPQILDNLAVKYSQIKIIHQANGGVSKARNTGLENAKGDYVIFVDGDDYLAPDFLEYMLGLVHKTGAEFCLSTCWYERKNEIQNKSDFIEVMKPEDALAIIISPDTTVYSANKIFKRSMLEKHNLFFDTDLFYGEGLNFITSVVQSVNKVGAGNRKIYYYRKNNNTSATTKFNIEKFYNGEKALNQVEKNLKLHTPKIETMLILHRSMFFIGAAVRIRTAGVIKEYKDYYKKCLSYVRQNYSKLVFKKEVSLYRKLLLLCGCINPCLLAKLDIIRRRRIIKRSID